MKRFLQKPGGIPGVNLNFDRGGGGGGGTAGRKNSRGTRASARLTIHWELIARKVAVHGSKLRDFVSPVAAHTLNPVACHADYVFTVL